MDSCFDENKSELRVAVLSVSLEMFSHCDCFLDQTVEVFREGGSETFRFKDSEDLVTCQESDLEMNFSVMSLWTYYYVMFLEGDDFSFSVNTLDMCIKVKKTRMLTNFRFYHVLVTRLIVSKKEKQTS